MLNLPPPDPRSSRLGFDEFIGVVIAFAVIGTILVVSLRDKNKGFRVESLTPLLTNPQATPNATPTPTPTGIPPQEQQATPLPLPVPTALAPATPTPPVTPQTPVKESRTTTVVPVPSSVAKASTPQRTATSTPRKVVNFTDVPQVFWARPYIEALAKRSVVSGFPDGTFRPNKPVTRAEFAAQIQKAFDQKVVMSAPNYKDVPNKFWASSAIQETTRSGFLRGYPGNTFRPNQKITKAQALVSLTKGLDLTSTSNPKQVLTVYQDTTQIPKYAIDTVAIATESGLVVNYPNREKLEPNQTLTRAEAAALTYQAMVKAGKVKAITSEYVVSPQAISKKQPLR